MRRHLFFVAIVFLAPWTGVAPGGEEDPTIERSYEGVPYRSGGVGTDERERLVAASSGYNLKIVFARKADTAFVSEARVVVEDGGKTILEAISGGPWFYTRLPPGTYRVVATIDSTSLEQNVTVGAEGQKQIAFYWPLRTGR